MPKKSRLQEYMEARIRELRESAEDCRKRGEGLLRIADDETDQANTLQTLIDAAASQGEEPEDAP